MRRRCRGWIWASVVSVTLVAAGVVGCREVPPPPREPPTITAPPPTTESVEQSLRLPKKAGSVRFAVIGDAGRGDLPQYEVSRRMQAYRRVFPFDFVVMAGDNVYDGGTPDDYRLKFELPYKPLLDDGVKFYAAIGNHDDPNQPYYAPFHMEGQRYYTFQPPSFVARIVGADVRFFMIDTEYIDREQLQWLDREMGKSTAEWKIPVFHRPLYTSGRYQRPALDLRRALESTLVRHDVSVAFSGHEHFYERTKPQRGITYFISGAAGSLRVGDLRPTGLTEVGFDRDYHFMLVEIEGRELHFQAISRGGVTIDSGTIQRPAHVGAAPASP